MSSTPSTSDLLAILGDALKAMQDEVNNRDGEDGFGLGCDRCEGGLSVPHSIGCRIRAAIAKAEGRKP